MTALSGAQGGDVQFMIVRNRKPPVEADKTRARHLWLDQIEDFPTASLEVAPGVRVKFLGYGDNMVGGEVVSGALIAVQRNAAPGPAGIPGEAGNGD